MVGVLAVVVGHGRVDVEYLKPVSVLVDVETETLVVEYEVDVAVELGIVTVEGVTSSVPLVWVVETVTVGVTVVVGEGTTENVTSPATACNVVPALTSVDRA